MQKYASKPVQTVRISPQLILRYHLLRLPSQQLAAHLREMSYENPLLDVHERHLCPRCGHELVQDSFYCRICGGSDDRAGSLYGALQSEGEAGDHWLEGVSQSALLVEDLWNQCLESDLAEKERYIACHLISDLDAHGFLSTPVEEHARYLACPVDAVESVRQRLMRFDPVGVGALDAQECLLVQAESRTPECKWAALAHRLIAEQWELLITGDLRKVARVMGRPFREIREVFAAMQALFYLYPANCHAGRQEETQVLQPDIRFSLEGRGGATTIRVDVLEAERYGVFISGEYRGWLKQPDLASDTRRQLLAWRREVRQVSVALQQRWQTMRQVALGIANFQRAFFLHDLRADELRPLTRDQVANAIGVHPSTVGRAVNGKYAELPNRRIVPLSYFFDSSTPIHAMITELVSGETAFLSDETLRKHLDRAGWSLTRRMVSLHREAMGILPTHLRRRQRRLNSLLGESQAPLAVQAGD